MVAGRGFIIASKTGPPLTVRRPRRRPYLPRKDIGDKYKKERRTVPRYPRKLWATRKKDRDSETSSE